MSASPPLRDDEPTDKVAAFITRMQEGELQILVFDHPEIDGSGIGPSVQLPAGTVEQNEAPEDAVLREAFEETGLTGLKLSRQLGSVPGLADGCWMVTRSIAGGELRRGHAVRETGTGTSSGEITVTWEGRAYTAPLDALTQRSTRYLFELRLGAPAPDRWEYKCDCGAPITVRWSSVRDAQLHPLQQRWLDAVRDTLTAKW